jgi:predicted N-acyltransferase
MINSLFKPQKSFVALNRPFFQIFTMAVHRQLGLLIAQLDNQMAAATLFAFKGSALFLQSSF